MNTIHDLRGALADHADIRDAELGARTSSVAHRVRVVRRRRAAGLAVAAAAVVAAAGITVPLAAHRQPQAATRLLGVAVPSTMSAAGYSFDYAGTAGGDADSARVRVPASDSPVVVSWVTQGADPTVRVSAEGATFSSSRNDFTDYVYVDPGVATTVKVSGHGTTALAVYHLDSTPPAGVSAGGITFRRDVPGRRLVDAAIAPEGANRQTFRFTVPAGATHLAFSELCSTTAGSMSPDGEAWMDVTINGQPAWGSACHDDSTFDPGSSLSVGPVSTYHPGEHVTVTLRLLDRVHGRPVVDPHARIGLGAYTVSTEQRRFGRGLNLPEVTESGGHTWRLVEARSGVARLGQRWTMRVPPFSERLMTVYTATGFSGAATAWPLVDGHRLSGLGVGRGVTGAVTTESGPAGSGRHTVGLEVTGAASARVAVGIYELAD